jgi:hypothetical protein
MRWIDRYSHDPGPRFGDAGNGSTDHNILMHGHNRSPSSTQCRNTFGYREN